MITGSAKPLRSPVGVGEPFVERPLPLYSSLKPDVPARIRFDHTAQERWRLAQITQEPHAFQRQQGRPLA
jgi:hypothetical protein